MPRKIVIFSLLSLLMWGCIKENVEDCGSGFRLQFRYIHNPQYRDLLAEQVQDIRVYAFDQQTGLLADIIRADRNDIVRGYKDVQIPKGTYTLMAWAGGCEDFTQECYSDFTVADAAAFDDPQPLEIGHASPDYYRMMLRCEEFAGTGRGDVAPMMNEFDDLFHASAKDITVVVEEKKYHQTVLLDFIKNTCTLKVTVTGLQYLKNDDDGDDDDGGGGARSGEQEEPTQILGVYATGNNGLYGYNNLVNRHAPMIHYESPCKTLTVGQMEVDIRMQRMQLALHNVEPVKLWIYHYESGIDMIHPLDVLETILSVTDDEGEYLYVVQEDIDREDEFHIEISILHDLTVHVRVNGFEIVNTEYELSKP